MTVLTRNPSSNTVISGSWTSATNFYAQDSTYATVAPAAYETDEIELGGFGFDGTLPTYLTITKVELVLRFKATTADIGYGVVDIWVDGLSLSELARVAPSSQKAPSSVTLYTFDVTALRDTWTRANFLDASLKLRVRAVCGPTSGTFSFDSAQVQVTYSPTGTGTGTGYAHATAQLTPTTTTRPRYQVELRKLGLPDKFDLIGVLDDFETMRYVRRYNQPGEFSIAVGDEHPLIEDLATRRRVFRVLRDGKEEFAGVMMHRAAQYDKGKGTFIWTLTGPDMSALVRRRATIVSTTDTIAYTGLPSAIINSLMTDNYIQAGGSSGTRGTVAINTSDVRMGYLTQRGTSGAWAFSNQMLGDIIYQIAQQGDVGLSWRLDLTSGQAVLHVVKGQDRSYPNGAGGGVYLTLTGDNLTSLSYEDDGLDAINKLYVGGIGDGKSRSRVTVENTTSQGEWGIQEGFLDYEIAGSTSGALTSAGSAYIAYRAATERVSFAFEETQAMKYKTHWDVGDVITVYIPRLDLRLHLRVYEVAVTLQKNAAPFVEVSVGVPIKNLEWRLQELQNKLAAATQNIPQEYAYTRELDGTGKTTTSDGDYVVGVRDGMFTFTRDLTTGLARMFARINGTWVGSNVDPFNADWKTTKVVSGFNKTTVSDSDFSTTPPDGATSVIYDTNAGDIRFGVRANGTWKVTGALT